MKPIFSISVLKSVRINAQEHSKSSSEKLQKTNRCDDKRAEKSSRRVVAGGSSRKENSREENSRGGKHGDDTHCGAQY